MSQSGCAAEQGDKRQACLTAESAFVCLHRRVGITREASAHCTLRFELKFPSWVKGQSLRLVKVVQASLRQGPGYTLLLACPSCGIRT